MSLAVSRERNPLTAHSPTNDTQARGSTARVMPDCYALRGHCALGSFTRHSPQGTSHAHAHALGARTRWALAHAAGGVTHTALLAWYTAVASVEASHAWMFADGTGPKEIPPTACSEGGACTHKSHLLLGDHKGKVTDGGHAT